MHLLYYIIVNDLKQIPYQTPIQLWANENIPDIVVYDFDNYSESVIIDSGVRLLEESEKLAVIIDAVDEARETGFITRFLNVLLNVKNKEIILFFNGQNKILKNMANAHHKEKTYFNLSEGEIKDRLSSYFIV